MLVFSFQWNKIKHLYPNTIVVEIKCLDKEGREHRFERRYEEWIGVCTGRIGKVVEEIRLRFPKCLVRHERLGDAKKILPYFETRLRTGKLAYRDKPFYKLYVSAPVHEVGEFFDKYKIAYHRKKDWAVRVYVDMCIRHRQKSFLYKWYEVDESSRDLLESFRMIPDRTDLPDFTVAAFDLETVPMDGGKRVPTGVDPTDSIVSVSIVKWNRRDGVSRRVLYRTPGDCRLEATVENGTRCGSEVDLLKKFHARLAGVQILTGYNILAFDLPCLFARLFWLKCNSVLKRYRSHSIGTHTVTTYDGMTVVDMYVYVKTFSSHNLPSLKLDEVAQVKLDGFTKIPVDSTGLHAWFASPAVTPDLVRSENADECHDRIRPSNIARNRFGTFRTYVDYCLRDSEVVHRLFDKEMALIFLVERSNFTAVDLEAALYCGNSHYLLQLFKSYGTVLGFFFNEAHFANATDMSKFESAFADNKETYQGALNYCLAGRFFEKVTVMDFNSMYPSALINANLCYGTVVILPRKEFLAALPTLSDSCSVLQYKKHGDPDFAERPAPTDTYRYPAFDPERDEFAIVVNRNTRAFLPTLVEHFLELRGRHQAEHKRLRNDYHFNAQLCIKILINSLYGVMASRESDLAYVPIAMAITALSRCQLLASYHYVTSLGYEVVYADTDSLMVRDWPYAHCDPINRFLNLNHVEIAYEQCMNWLVVLSKKRYVYETEAGRLVPKGFQKRVNSLIRFMTEYVLTRVFDALKNPRPDAYSHGWIVWVEMLQRANYMCRNPKEYGITRKTKRLDEYKSKSCPAVRILQKHPEKENDFIEFVYSRADVQTSALSEWIVTVDECRHVDFEHLFIGQKKIFCALLNIAFWRLENPHNLCQAVLNAMRWKQLVHAELMHWHRTGNKIVMVVERGCKYTFEINDHFASKKRVIRRATKRKREERLRASWIPGADPTEPGKDDGKRIKL